MEIVNGVDNGDVVLAPHARITLARTMYNGIEAVDRKLKCHEIAKYVNDRGPAIDQTAIESQSAAGTIRLRSNSKKYPRSTLAPQPCLRNITARERLT